MPKPDKGKGKAKEIEPEDDLLDDDEEEGEDESEEDGDDDDEDLDQDLEDLINDVDPSDIVPVTRQRSARSKNIDYSSAEAMQRAGLDADQAHTQAAKEDEEEEEDADFKGDETMEDDY